MLTRSMFERMPEEKTKRESLHPFGERLEEVGDVARVAGKFDVGKEARFITGAELKVDGGYTML